MTDEKESYSRWIIAVVIALIIMSVLLLLLLDMDYDIIPFIDLGPSDSLHKILLILVIISFVWLVLLIISKLFEIVMAPKVGRYAYVKSVWKAINYSIWAVVLLLLFFYLLGGVSTAVLSIGLIGAALTFVLQKPLLNMLGWIFITYNRIYRIGDRVNVGNIKGYVTDIKVMHTSLYEIEGWMKGETFTGRITMVPNGLIFDGPIHNYTRDSPFIWDEVTNLVTYESDIENAKQIMLESAKEVIGDVMEQKHEAYRRRLELHDLDDKLPMGPLLRMDLSDSGVNISVVYWCPAEARRKIRSDITEKVWERFMEDPDVQIAYPHMELVRHKPSWDGDLEAPRAKKKK